MDPWMRCSCIMRMSYRNNLILKNQYRHLGSALLFRMCVSKTASKQSYYSVPVRNTINLCYEHMCQHNPVRVPVQSGQPVPAQSWAHGLLTGALRPAHHDFVASHYEQGITSDMARDMLEDSNYFGTMMVRAGDADGMVSGACHTTASTIRPALQASAAASPIAIPIYIVSQNICHPYPFVTH